jgi:WD40 repeat protein
MSMVLLSIGMPLPSSFFSAKKYLYCLIFKYEEILHCCEISSDGHYYVFAGDKGHLKFGALSKGNPTDMEEGHMGAHSNRVYCLKWNPFDPNMFFSGGWDKTVFVWDIRKKTAV